MPRPRRASSMVAVLAPLLLLTGLTACAEDDDGGAKPEGPPLSQALARVRADDAKDTSVTWTATGAVRRLSDDPADERLSGLRRSRAMPLSSYTPDPRPLGIDAGNITEEIVFGEGGAYGRWSGTFDPVAAGDRLGAAGYTGSTREPAADWTSPSAPLGAGTVRVRADAVVFGPKDDGVPGIAIDGRAAKPTLADEPRFRELARCLGDVVRADFVPTTAEKDGVTLLAVGVRATTVTDATEVVCASTPDEEAARSLTERWRAVTRDDLAKKLAAPVVDTPGGDQHVVRLVAGNPDPDAVIGNMFLVNGLMMKLLPPG